MGEQLIAKISLILLLVPIFSKVSGAFLSVDLMHLNVDPFAFCHNLPVHFVDKNGLAPTLPEGSQSAATIETNATASTGYFSTGGAAERYFIIEDNELFSMGLNLGVTKYLDEFTNQLGGLNWQQFGILDKRSISSWIQQNSYPEVFENMQRTIAAGGKIRFNTKRLFVDNVRKTDGFMESDDWLITEIEMRAIRVKPKLWENTEWWRPRRTIRNTTTLDVENRYHLIPGNEGIPHITGRPALSRRGSFNEQIFGSRTRNNSHPPNRSYASEQYVRMSSDDMRLMGITPVLLE